MIFPILMGILSPMIPFLMNPYSSLVRLIHGMEIFFSISKSNAFNLAFHVMNDVLLDTIQNYTLSLATPCTAMALILSYDIA
jgi:hypothetical protein